MTARFLHDERNQDATIYIGGIDEKTTDSLLRSESWGTRKGLRNSRRTRREGRRTRREGRRTSKGRRRTRTRLLRMNCCKLRYMKILGGLRAVPEKPNLTYVLTRTPFMTVTIRFESLSMC